MTTVTSLGNLTDFSTLPTVTITTLDDTALRVSVISNCTT